ncbi:unnamed protein product [Paramecium pentaurelia]|uniref:TLDc domain-containing protein n=1 Tax=Paramecium pentaurelia TaxID=43138 RepID=A0A8S1YLT1_9CILI|nr:unnamed protein product [Paramecium pentaurelia]
MIFKSKSGYIFGGFSPCKWQQQQYKSQSINDDSLSSFIFSQTHDQIYPLKQAQKFYAICCSANNGLAFGRDLVIDSNFQNGSSYLGETYYWDDQYKQNDQKIHLFGSLTPNITELEVYEVY